MTDAAPIATRLSRSVAQINMLSACAALLVASTLLIVFQFLLLRGALVDDAEVQARIVGDSASSAVLFNDRYSATEKLHAIAASPNISAAAIFSVGGAHLANYYRRGYKILDAPDASLIEHGHRFSFQHLYLAHPIEFDQKVVGYIVTRTSMRQMYTRLLGFAALTLMVALGSLGATFLLMSRMRMAVQRAENHLDYLAHTDPVTALPNRHAFNERLALSMAQVDRFGGMLGLLLLDLDNFKLVNDTLGHHNGDKLLMQVARRLTTCLRSSDIVCRIGGDEFAVILESKNVDRKVEAVADKILAVLVEPFLVDGHEIHMTASIGISVYPQDAPDLQTLTRNADTAMYQAKDKGKNGYEKFCVEMDQRAQKRLAVEASLRKALERGELELYYQPQLDLASGRIIGAEALLRWMRPGRETIGPDEFIPVAEESGLIVPIGRWILHTACRQAAAWRAAGYGDIAVAVNMSVRQTKDAALVGDILSALRQAQLPPHLLEIEITESVLMENVHVNVDLLNRLQAEGIRLAVDDFGTGYSSMAYLKRFPIDQLKIDGTFVRDIPGAGDDEAIVTAIIAMAHQLGLTVVGEGVETEEQLEFLRDAGCNSVQGFHIAAPMPAEKLAAFLQEQRHNTDELERMRTPGHHIDA